MRHLSPLLALPLLFCVACGDSDSEPDEKVDIVIPDVPLAPTVVINAPSTAVEGTVISLRGDASIDRDGDIVGYLWEQVEGSPSVALTGENTANAGFTAPDVGEMTPLSFSLTVTDSQGLTSTGSVRITVIDSNRRPEAIASGPESVGALTEFFLRGQDSTDSDGTISSFQWSQLPGPAATISDGATNTATVVAPDVTVEAELTFRLTITDDQGKQDTADVLVDVTPTAGKLAFRAADVPTQFATETWPSLTVEIQNSNDAVITGGSAATQMVQLEVSDGSGTLHGSTTQTADRGVATFEDLSYSASGDITLRAFIDGTDLEATLPISVSQRWPATLGATDATVSLRAVSIGAGGTVSVAGNASGAATQVDLDAGDGAGSTVADADNAAAFITQYTATGSLLRLGTLNSDGTNIAALTGNLYAANYSGALTVKAGGAELASLGATSAGGKDILIGNDAFLALTSDPGSRYGDAWSLSIGGTGDDWVNALHLHEGNALVAGGFDSADLELEPCIDSTTTAATAGGDDAFVALYSLAPYQAEGCAGGSSTALLWSYTAGGTGDEEIIAVDSNTTQVLLAGQTDGDITFAEGEAHTFTLPENAGAAGFLVILNAADGSVTWSAIAAGSDSDFNVGGAAFTDDGHIVVVGSFVGDIDIDVGENDNPFSAEVETPFLLLLDNTGAFVAAHLFAGEAGADTSISALLVEANTIWLSGTAEGSLTLGDGLATGAGETAAFVSQFEITTVEETASFVHGWTAASIKSDAATEAASAASGGLASTEDPARWLVHVGQISGDSIDLAPSMSATAAGTQDGFIVKLDATGSAVP